MKLIDWICIGWFPLGAISGVLLCKAAEGKVLVKDLYFCFIAGFFGPLITLFLVLGVVDSDKFQNWCDKILNKQIW